MVVHLLTDVGGRQSFIVQGVKSRSGRGSKSALFQPLFTVVFEALTPTRGELHRFREVQSGIRLQRTPFDIRRSTISLFIAEVLYRLVKESAPNSDLFERVWHAIAALDTIDDGLANFHLWFLANLSRDLGFVPSGSYREGMWFDIKEGLYTMFKPSHRLIMEQAQTQLFSRLLESDVAELGAIELNRNQRVEMLESLLNYYGFHLDAINEVRSISILKELF